MHHSVLGAKVNEIYSNIKKYQGSIINLLS